MLVFSRWSLSVKVVINPWAWCPSSLGFSPSTISSSLTRAVRTPPSRRKTKRPSETAKQSHHISISQTALPPEELWKKSSFIYWREVMNFNNFETMADKCTPLDTLRYSQSFFKTRRSLQAIIKELPCTVRNKTRFISSCHIPPRCMGGGKVESDLSVPLVGKECTQHLRSVNKRLFFAPWPNWQINWWQKDLHHLGLIGKHKKFARHVGL